MLQQLLLLLLAMVLLSTRMVYSLVYFGSSCSGLGLVLVAKKRQEYGRTPAGEEAKKSRGTMLGLACALCVCGTSGGECGKRRRGFMVKRTRRGGTENEGRLIRSGDVCLLGTDAPLPRPWAVWSLQMCLCAVWRGGWPC